MSGYDSRRAAARTFSHCDQSVEALLQRFHDQSRGIGGDPVSAKRQPLLAYSGMSVEQVTLTDALGWVRRVRAGLRPIEHSLRQLPVTTDPEKRAELLKWLVEFAEDVAGAAGELQNIAEATSARGVSAVTR